MVGAKTYAHSTFRYNENSGLYERNKHHDKDNGAVCLDDCCDKDSYYPKRFSAAKEVMKHVIFHVNNNSEGMLQDFGISTGYYGTTNADRFYLNCLVPYAKAVNSSLYSEWARNNGYYYTSFNYGSIDAGINDTLQP